MPADDLILNVRQIDDYPDAGPPQRSDSILVQRGGLGGPYLSMTPVELVSTALEGGGPFTVGLPVPPVEAGPNNILTNWIMTNAYALNAYGIADDVWAYYAPGPAAKVEFSALGNLIFTLDPGGSPGQSIGWGDPVVAFTPAGDIHLVGSVLLGRDPVAPLEAATMQFVGSAIAASQEPAQALYDTATVWSWNGRTGNVFLTLQDVQMVGGAPIFSPAFQGCPTAPIPPAWSNDNTIATTSFVNVMASWWARQVFSDASMVTSFNGRTGDVVLTAADLESTGVDLLNNANLTGIPTAPTAAPTTNTSQVATTAFVQTAINAALGQDLGFAPINNPQFTGVPTAPTAPPGSNTGQIATTAFVEAAIVASTTGVSSFNTRTGAVTLTPADITNAAGALISSPTFIGTPLAPTAAPGTNNTQIATTAFVAAALAAVATGVTSFNTRTGAVVLQPADITGAGGAPLASPAFTGTPTGPTAAPGTNTTQLATTAYVLAELTALGEVTSFNGRTGAVTFQANDLSAVGGALLNSPNFTGTPLAPTALAGTNSTQIATTAYVMATVNGMVASWNGRSGAVTLTLADITSAGGAPLSSPSFTGIPAAPTAALATNTNQVATCAFVQTAIANSTVGVMSFNGRTGAVTLSTADITGAGGAPAASPAFTGTPTAATASPGTSTGQLATTAFVQAALAATGVASFNGRTGAVTFLAADLSAVGGAPLASPAFTGTPTGPTATAGTATAQLATCQFVTSALAGAGGVTTFNGRAGTVLLTTADVSGANGLLTTGGTMTGQLNVNVGTAVNSIVITPTAAVGANIVLDKASGQNANLWGQQAGSNRWQLVLGSATAEGSGNSGSDFVLQAYDNSGAVLGTYLAIARGSGTATFSQPNGTGIYNVLLAPVAGAANLGVQAPTGLNSATVNIAKGGSGAACTVQGFTGGGLTTANLRWTMALGNPTAEGTNNVGSDFIVQNYSNSGALLGSPFQIDRSNGYTLLNGSGATTITLPGATNGSPHATLILNKAGSGTAAQFQARNNGVLRWNLALGDATAESANAGSNFTISAFNDAGGGATVPTPLTISRSTGVATFAVAIVNGPSDRRLKENIAPLEGSLDKVQALQGVSFNFIAMPDKPEIGLIAQDVEAVVPEVVQRYEAIDADGKSLGERLALDYPKLVAVLIEAVKTLSARVETLEARIAA